MRHLPEDIIEALRIIKNTCEEQEDCVCCPFGDNTELCLINSIIPKEWDINPNPPAEWKALR